MGCGTRHLTTIGLLWSLPNTLLGFGFALLSLAWPRQNNGVVLAETNGGLALSKRVDGVLVAETNRGLAWLFLTRRGFGAITFGRVIVTTVPLTAHLLVHESHHSRQYEVLGPFFLPIYLWLHARHGYHDNPLEVEAQMCAAHARYT